MEFKFDKDGLIPAIIQDTHGQVLMLAYMNEESLAKTRQTKETWFFSRSRQELWHKGATSGQIQKVVDITTDCDHDALLITIEQQGDGACHEGDYSCFHNPVDKAEVSSGDAEISMGPEILDEVYKVILGRKTNPKEGSYTNYLFDKGIDKILKKVGEETAEVIIAAKNNDLTEIAYETGDLFYHLLVMLAERGVEPQRVWDELKSRR